MAFSDDVAQRGWQTGSVVPADLLHALSPHLSRPGQAAAAIGEHDWLLVVSQTCDIVASRFDAEPFVEVLHDHQREGKPRKEFVDLRSTRQIDFRPNPGTHKDLVLTAHAIGDRYIVPREWFTQNAPDPARRLSVDAARRLLAWYALRAARPSRPDELERRLRGAKPALLDALTLLADDIAEVSQLQLCPELRFTLGPLRLEPIEKTPILLFVPSLTSKSALELGAPVTHFREQPDVLLLGQRHHHGRERHRLRTLRRRMGFRRALQ